MENEEKEDLLLEVTESEDEIYEKDEIDYYIEKKILHFIHNEKPNTIKTSKKTLIFIATCLFMFLSSSILIVTLPIYLKYSTFTGISTYSKLVSLSLLNAILFGIAHFVNVLSKCKSHNSPNYNICFGDVLKISFLLSIGNISVMWLMDGNLISCHLKDPLKGFSVIFSLLFYFVFSRKKMSLERTFCAITIAIGVFVSVDFGICDKFKCNGNSNLTEETPKLHFLYIILYLLAHGVWVLHFTLIEICWTSLKGLNPNLNVSVLSKVSSNVNTGRENVKPKIQSLSMICQDEEEQEFALKNENFSNLIPNKKSFSNSKYQNSNIFSSREPENSLSHLVPYKRNQLSVTDFKKFPMTSTPNNEAPAWQSWTSGKCYDIALWQHTICCLIVLALCWVPTLSFLRNEKGKLLVDIISEIFESFRCHSGLISDPDCSYLPLITILVSISYVVLVFSSIELLKTAQSAVTVISIMMSALPVAALFWSLFQINEDTANILEFSPEITGEAVCAILGFPIIGIGIVLLIKSHIREFNLII